jgi:hypothetical protein
LSSLTANFSTGLSGNDEVKHVKHKQMLLKL